MTEMILLKLGELVLKGANRYTFEDKLKSNLARRLKSHGKFRVYSRQSTTYIEPLSDECDMDAAYDAAKKVFGAVGVSRPRPAPRPRRLCWRRYGPIWPAIWWGKRPLRWSPSGPTSPFP